MRHTKGTYTVICKVITPKGQTLDYEIVDLPKAYGEDLIAYLSKCMSAPIVKGKRTYKTGIRDR